MSNKVQVERNIIYSSMNRRPYGVRLKFVLQEHYDFKFEGECTLLVDKGVILRVIPENENPHLKGYCIKVLAYGFSTAGEAEQMGLKISLGLLWSAVSKNYSIATSKALLVVIGRILICFIVLYGISMVSLIIKYCSL